MGWGSGAGAKKYKSYLDVKNIVCKDLTRYWITSCEGISTVTVYATTDWAVIYHLTFGTETASSRTRVETFLVNTGPVWWTL